MLVYQVLKEVGESFLVVTNHDTRALARVEMISQKLPFLGEILAKLSIEVRDETKIDFLMCIAKNNFNYISGYNPVLVQKSIRQMMEMFAKNEAMPVVGNFAKSNVENTRSKSQDILNRRPEYIKYAKWGKYDRKVPINPSSADKYNWFNLKGPLLTRVKQNFVGNVLPAFLSTADREVARCYEPVHCGIFMNFLSSFINYNVCPDAVNDSSNIVSQVVKKTKKVPVEYFFAPKDASAWCFLYENFDPKNMICKPLRHHMDRMLQFATTFKYLLFIFGLKNSSQVDDFVAKNSAASFAGKMKERIRMFSKKWQTGKLVDFLPSCGCSDYRNHDDCCLSINPDEEKGFCYHNKIGPVILKKYRMLHDFYNSAKKIGGWPRVGAVPNSVDFLDLTKYKNCSCGDVLVHGEINFHNIKFPDQALTPLHMVYGRVLQNVVFVPDVVGKNALGNFEGRFETVGKPDTTGFEGIDHHSLDEDRINFSRMKSCKGKIFADFDVRIHTGVRKKDPRNKFGQPKKSDLSIFDVDSDDTISDSDATSCDDVDECDENSDEGDENPDDVSDEMFESIPPEVDENFIPYNSVDFNLDFYQDMKIKDENFVLEQYGSPESYAGVLFRYHVCWNGNVVVICNSQRYDLDFRFRRFFVNGYLTGKSRHLTGVQAAKCCIQDPVLMHKIVKLMSSNPETHQFKMSQFLHLTAPAIENDLTSEQIRDLIGLYVAKYDFCQKL